MTRHSLRLRLALAGAASCALALVVAFFGLSLLFERHVERRILDELTVHLDQVIAGLDRAPDGGVSVVRAPADPRFHQPMSGLYCQIDLASDHRISRSLWDSAIQIPDPTGDGPQKRYIDGPGGTPLIAIFRNVITEARLGNLPVRTIVAVNRSVIADATAAFRRDMLPYLALLAALLFTASLAQISFGLRPFAELRRRIAL